MRAVILAAGRGHRLRDVTGDRPKCLARIGNGSLLSVRSVRSADAEGSTIAVVAGAEPGDDRDRLDTASAERTDLTLEQRAVADPRQALGAVAGHIAEAVAAAGCQDHRADALRYRVTGASPPWPLKWRWRARSTRRCSCSSASARGAAAALPLEGCGADRTATASVTGLGGRMRAVILAAGRGCRLRDVVGDRPKCLARSATARCSSGRFARCASAVSRASRSSPASTRPTSGALCGRSVDIVVNTALRSTNSLYSLWLARDLLDRWLRGAQLRRAVPRSAPVRSADVPRRRRAAGGGYQRRPATRTKK